MSSPCPKHTATVVIQTNMLSQAMATILWWST